MVILFVDACVRESSRTRRLAEQVIQRIRTHADVVTVFKPGVAVSPIKDEEFILSRNRASETHDFSSPIYAPAKQFAEADVIIIAAPYWDLSFPAILKAYFEQINVLGLTFEYTEDGMPRGLCKAKKLVYVTTAGGPIISDEYGYGYIRTMAQAFYGIVDISQVKAEGLDMLGADVEKILKRAMDKL